MGKISHADERGRARMVDVSGKVPQRRTARAFGRIALGESTIELIRENKAKKGDVLAVAQIAGIQAAKRTAELVPLCHSLVLDFVDVRMQLVADGLTAASEVRCTGRTGVEMEALTAVTIALLTVYDMCKAADKRMCITDIRLTEKVKHDV